MALIVVVAATTTEPYTGEKIHLGGVFSTKYKLIAVEAGPLLNSSRLLHDDDASSELIHNKIANFIWAVMAQHLQNTKLCMSNVLISISNCPLYRLG